jgi:hypothetical protein
MVDFSERKRVNGSEDPPESGKRAVAGTLGIRITDSAGEVHDLRYRFIWSAWLDGELLGKGHAFKPEAAEAQAMDLVTDLVTPDEVGHIEIIRA